LHLNHDDDEYEDNAQISKLQHSTLVMLVYVKHSSLWKETSQLQQQSTILPFVNNFKHPHFTKVFL
jgi:hypothetical protein